MPTLPNPIPENEFTVPLGNEQDLISASSDTTAETPSTDLPLTDVVSSGTESLPTNIQPISGITNHTLDNAGNIPIPTNPIQNPMVKNMGAQLNLNNRNLANIDAFYNATEKKSATNGSKISLGIDTDINNESLITEDGEKAYANINGFNIPKKLLPDENENNNILYDRDGNLNPWIKADKINLDELKPAPFNEYTISLTDNVKEGNANILKLSQEGIVEI